jgi:hypothetical protein
VKTPVDLLEWLHLEGCTFNSDKTSLRSESFEKLNNDHHLEEIPFADYLIIGSHPNKHGCEAVIGGSLNVHSAFKTTIRVVHRMTGM